MTQDTIEHIGNSVFELRDINPSQLGVSSKQINYWIQERIVPFATAQQTYKSKEKTVVESKHTASKKTKTKWVKLNLAQAVWVSIVDQLIKFNIPTETLEELAYKIWQKPRVDKHADGVFKYHIDKNPNSLPNHEINKLKSHLKNELLMEHHFRTILNPFTDMVKSAFYRDKIPHTFLYVPETNDYKFRMGDNSLILDLASVYLQNPMISLPFVPIMAKVFTVELENTKKKDLSYLTNIEKQIRDLVVFKNPKKIEIAFENNEIKPIIITEQHKTRVQLAKYILENKIAKNSKLLIDIRSQDNYKITLIKK